MNKELGFDSRKGQRTFPFPKALRPALKPIQLPVKLEGGGGLSQDIKEQRHDGHSPPSGAKVKNGGATSPLPLSLHAMTFIQKENFLTLAFIFITHSTLQNL
jgi:hypothetical protein